MWNIVRLACTNARAFCYDIAEAEECLLPAANQFACTIYMVYFYLSNLSVRR